MEAFKNEELISLGLSQEDGRTDIAGSGEW